MAGGLTSYYVSTMGEMAEVSSTSIRAPHILEWAGHLYVGPVRTRRLKSGFNSLFCERDGKLRQLLLDLSQLVRVLSLELLVLSLELLLDLSLELLLDLSLELLLLLSASLEGSEAATWV